ncbi:polysaccharide deacetylase family protein [Paenibacillus sp. CAU 1782]
MENIILWGFYVMTFYAFLPGLISRTFGFRVFKKGKTEKEIALTFDDGPDPHYTPLLLDLLARYNAKATFFIVGSHAEGQDELLRRIHEEGHVLGIHNYVHKSNWLMRPKTVKRQIEMTNDLIQRATGQRSTFYRPPWGIINLFDYSNMGHMQIILWSAMFGDWRLRLGAKRLEKRMLKKLSPGQVLLLHDCGMTFGADKDAPRNMLEALETYLEQGKRAGNSFVGIDKMIALTDANRKMSQSLFKRIIISLWLLWEKAFHVVFRLKVVGNDNPPAFHYRVTKYGGESVSFEDGSKVEKGDRIAELHFDNRMLSGLAATSKSPLATGIRMLREVERALPRLAKQLKADPDAVGVKAVYGVTMIHRGAERLGFHVYKLKEGLFARSTRIYLRVLLKVLTNTKQYDKSRKRKSENGMVSPRMLLMPIPKLLTYAEEDGEETHASTPAGVLEENLAVVVQESAKTTAL